MLKIRVDHLVELQKLDFEISSILKDAFELEKKPKASEKSLLKKLEGMKKERIHLTKTLDSLIVKRYERLKGNKSDSNAVVPVIKAVCQGCFIGVSTSTYAEIQRKDVAANCDHCGRFIYYQAAS